LRLALIVLCLWPVLVFGYPLTPDVKETPGSVCNEDHEDFEEYRYPEQIPYCFRNVASSLKKKIYDWYGIPQNERKEYTIDHLIPLSLGGDNEDDNLWPEHKEVKALRPDLEIKLYVKLRDGKLKQRAAIDQILEAKFDPDKVRQLIERKLRPLNFKTLVEGQF